MEKTISFDELRNSRFFIDRLECHRQIWKDGSRWEGNVNTPRAYFGLCVVCSDIKASYFSDGKLIFTASKGDIIYLPKGCKYRAEFRGCGNGIDIYTINFTLFDKDGNELCLPCSPLLFRETATPFCRDTASLLADAFLFSKSELKKQSLFLGLLDAFLSAHDKLSKKYHIIKSGVELLRKEWNQKEKIKKYADVCGISESGFYTFFKEWAGESPIDYRNNIRITAAKSMLENSNLRISEIAYTVGFDDQYYFTRIFKKRIGMSPKEFRNK